MISIRIYSYLFFVRIQVEFRAFGYLFTVQKCQVLNAIAAGCRYHPLTADSRLGLLTHLSFCHFTSLRDRLEEPRAQIGKSGAGRGPCCLLVGPNGFCISDIQFMKTPTKTPQLWETENGPFVGDSLHVAETRGQCRR